MNITHLKYLAFITLPITVCIAFTNEGWLTFIPFAYVFGIVPGFELFLRKNESNYSDEEEKILLQSKYFDIALYSAVLIHMAVFIWFFPVITKTAFSSLTFYGRIIAMGLMCGVIGINVAHELGHRVTKSEQFLAKTLLFTSLYMHFFIEHNRGHHRNVSTPEDPSSARFNEILYVFWFRSVIFAYLGAWRLEAKRLKRIGKSALNLSNEMLQFQLIQLAGLAAVYWFFGLHTMLAFVGAATVGFLLLETVNYIEHYGLARKKVTENRYEAAGPEHSWNSDHLIGRTLLFELSRHSDHHFQPNRKYQILRHYDESPQMPTGYPGMMLLSAIPPLWFSVMHKHMKQNNLHPELA